MSSWSRQLSSLDGSEENLIVDTVYKGHDIHASAWELLEPIGWEPHLHVSWWKASQKIIKSFTLNQVFSTRQEAGRAGLSFAQKWIDDGKPDRSSQT
jgi:hypothetical protein